MLAGAGLGDDAVLPHPLREEGLADGVVDLVRAGVEEILALQIDRVSDVLGDAPGEVQRGRAAHVVVQERVELGAEERIAAGLDPRALELVERRYQGLRDIAPPIRPEAPRDAGLRARPARAHATSTRSARSTARKNAFSLAGSLRPGEASVPLAVSTANG